MKMDDFTEPSDEKWQEMLDFFDELANDVLILDHESPRYKLIEKYFHTMNFISALHEHFCDDYDTEIKIIENKIIDLNPVIIQLIYLIPDSDRPDRQNVSYGTYVEEDENIIKFFHENSGLTTFFKA